ncbi:hypothetical protein L484_001202 [Morus notabilis]|uniref:Uncharacterized protein n=1 Tax=Morus notabilis TaxID=981085 RepID=W9S5N0_9ROSA|nr:hypothetical protein L484_001202 [Morus notabilis]
MSPSSKNLFEKKNPGTPFPTASSHPQSLLAAHPILIVVVLRPQYKHVGRPLRASESIRHLCALGSSHEPSIIAIVPPPTFSSLSGATKALFPSLSDRHSSVEPNNTISSSPSFLSNFQA